ncbi:pyruvate formate-lyase activating enzyme [Ferrimonas balearica DSM 9799]|uniref:Pyruvate formate-lyase-activating enzyme n=1 Tax=Ferrimonas balearica (strain DSM 9799 / CCM 4581 / KCTC 23876 / PAT) TaxID=550540 RepID=E1SPD6_FERBD|nr:pyruvate formate lyase 1-activating protein [Ferrimonas balearica]MBY6017240.1 pyruvate formate lyase 1-activating protein [Halomonas denitrificans]ADN76753.1 pyruvate formate-lyase activating enzyme [Ferrimonas balearica DSM 9799]MBW3140260.1 pyruvate formate lyase 1-activating protein [Ferrimonas balearica]MBW3166270.1 pyruvate formate lyase 1-activating protein [Ferrimonas balearica]MBY5979856.1 pyruvate formate lyase 1-activating protein [Ferrimonas balearica]
MGVIGRVHSWETCGTVDGPGIRFIAFLQGCLMRCQYCHNRDTWDLEGGKEVTVPQLMEQLVSYRHFFEASGGGVTASGGEAVLQMDFVKEWFTACKAEGIHTCLDTNGLIRKYTPVVDEMLDVTDLVMLDIKQMDDSIHQNLVGVSNKRPLEFAQHLAKRGQKTWIRYVIVPGFTDDDASAEKLAEFLAPMKNVEKVEMLPYHELGKHKWEALGETYPLDGVKPPPKETMERLKAIFVAHGLNAMY